MPTYDIPITASINCSSIEEARELAYKALALIQIDNASIVLARDDMKIPDGRRVVILHPEDGHSDFDPKAKANKEG